MTVSGFVVAALMSGGTLAHHALIVEEPIGRPIQVLQTPMLPAGVYEFETNYLTPDPSTLVADTVMAIRTGSGVNASTIDGSDGCGGDPRRSCVRITLTEAQQLYVWVWAWHPLLQGEADVRFQRMETATAPLSSEICPDWSATPFGCWNVLAEQAPFGGIALTAGELGTDLDELSRFETTELPGAELAPVPSQHAIMFLDGTSREFNLLPNQWFGGEIRGAPGTHHSRVAGTAEWTGVPDEMRLAADGIDPDEFDSINPYLLVGPLGKHSGGPYRFMRNDWVEHHHETGVTWRGDDEDGDRLGRELEVLLETCDSVSSPDANGKSCRELSGCSVAAFDADMCRAACRDSDQDGMRDDHEMFGVSLFEGAYVEGMELARYGADPATYDVMVEVDYPCFPSESWWYQPEPLCSWTPPGFEPPSDMTAAEYFELAAAGETPPVPAPPDNASTEPNCWLYGSTPAQFPTPDELAGIADIYAAIPDFDNRSGRNGIAVHFDAGFDPPPDLLGVFGRWGGSRSMQFLEECTDKAFLEHWLDLMQPQRRWLFRHAMFDQYRRGGGKAGVPSSYLVAGGAWQIAHELGHAGGLDHDGPGGDPRASQNYNPIYRSRVNYLYEGLTITGPERTDITFSDGSTPGRLNPLALDEECPFGDGFEMPSDLLDKLPGAPFPFDPSSMCQPVDWDADGTIDADLVHAPLRTDHMSTFRTYFAVEVDGETENIPFQYVAGTADLAVGDTSLVMAAVEAVREETDDGTTIWRHRPTIRFTGNFGCTECGGLADNCWSEVMGETVVLTADDEPIDDAKAIAVTWLDGRYIWVVHRGSDIVWGELGESSGSSNAEGSLDLEVLPSTALYETPVSLTTVSSTEVLLAFREGDGTVQTVRGESGSGMTWTALGAAVDGDGQVLVATSGTSVGLATVDGAPTLAVSVDVDSTARLGVFAESGGDNEWSKLGQVEVSLRGAPQLAYTGYPSKNRLIISMQGQNNDAMFAQSFPNDLSTYTQPEIVTRYAMGFPNPIAWDARTGITPGLRGWRTETQCGPDSCGTGMACFRRDGTPAISTGNTNQCRSEVPPDPMAPMGTPPTPGPEVEVVQFLLPFQDGVLPLEFIDMDDRPHMRQDYCRVIRGCASFGGVCTPPEWRELDPSGVPYGEALCSPTPAVESSDPFDGCVPIWED